MKYFHWSICLQMLSTIFLRQILESTNKIFDLRILLLAPRDLPLWRPQWFLLLCPKPGQFQINPLMLLTISITSRHNSFNNFDNNVKLDSQEFCLTQKSFTKSLVFCWPCSRRKRVESLIIFCGSIEQVWSMMGGNTNINISHHQLPHSSNRKQREIW